MKKRAPREKVEIAFPYITPVQLSKELGFDIRKDFIKKRLNVKPEFENGTIAVFSNGNLIKERLIKHITRTLNDL